MNPQSSIILMMIITLIIITILIIIIVAAIITMTKHTQQYHKFRLIDFTGWRSAEYLAHKVDLVHGLHQDVQRLAGPRASASPKFFEQIFSATAALISWRLDQVLDRSKNDPKNIQK